MKKHLWILFLSNFLNKFFQSAKRISLIVLLLFYTSLMFSQPWLNNLPQTKTKGKLTFFDYKNAFDKYWAPFNVDKGYYMLNGVKTKAAGWKQFKRWEYYIESQVNPTTGALPEKPAIEIYEEYLRTNPKSEFSTSASWTSFGPNNSDGGYAGVGRLNCIAFHPSNNNIYWVGAASGGLWVTTNNGTSWTCLTNSTGALAVSDIVIPTDFATSNTIYIATGDKDHWDNRSIGVLKSTNGGSTWSTTGISFTLSDGDMVNSLLLDPGNNQTLIAATSNGVYKTTNGGTTWSSKLSSVAFIDMEYKPGDFNTLYGSTQTGRIYVTSDGGGIWTQAFYDASARRIELAVSGNQPTWVYAVAANSTSGLYGIYKSTSSGSVYSSVFAGTTKNLLGWESNGSDSGGQGFYDLSLASSPSNANTLLVGGVNTWRSVDGGTAWALVNHWWGDGVPAVHADKHSLVFRSNGDLFECNDGGIYSSTNSGTSWTDRTNGMIISQMYKLGVSMTVSNEVIAGLQDNGTKLLSSGIWSDVKGGDGMECLIDYTNVDIQYGTYVYGQISRTKDHWVTSIDIEPSSAGNGAWVTPYIIDPNNSQTLYAGYSDVWKSANMGDSWTKISTINAPSKIRSMAIAPSNTQYLYVAEYDRIWKTTDEGALWTDITGSLPVSSGSITNVAIKNNDENTVWVTMGSYDGNTIYQSINGGSSWTNISTGLPQIPVYTIVQNKQSVTEVQLYAGTEVGLYFKKGTNNWIAYNTGLPNVKIGEIEIFYSSNPAETKLRAATYGRGLWESTVYYSSAPMTYLSSTATQNNTGNAVPNQANQEIIGIQIVTDGDLSPLSATSFTLSTTGSTNPVTDITNAKLFYTGVNSSFATTTQFGTTSNSPNGTFTITGTQTLGTGINYFWLTYDVPLTATIGNVLDARCTSLTVGTSKTPSVTNPSGNRQIAISYCSAGAEICDEYISNVTIGTINNSSNCSTGGYADYSGISTNIVRESTLEISVQNGTPYVADNCGIWIDWNNNGDFLDDPAVTVTGSPGMGPYTATILCQGNASTGLKRMRIRIHYNDESTSPCGTSRYGEVEDYSVNVIAGCNSPTSQATSYTSSLITKVSMTAGWVRGNGNSVLVVARAGSAVNSDPVSGSAYTANTAFGNGTQIGTGNYVVYSGTGTSVNITNLSPGTAYFLAIYEYSAANCYKTPALTGNALTYNSDAIIDIEGNYYNIITIGSQVWMSENLKTKKYNDNSSIPLVTDNTEWGGLTTPAYCWYNNDAAAYKTIYGALYNWYTVNALSNGGKNVCPTGWHVPTDAEWTIVTTYLGGESVAGGKMKETGTTHWLSPNTGATNESGFTGLPGSGRTYTGGFLTLGNNAIFWSSTTYDDLLSWYLVLQNNSTSAGRYNGMGKQAGASVRCVKDNASVVQDISFITGWNIMSFAAEPDNMSMLTILNPMITAGTLIKVQDENGNAVEKLPDPIGWVNNIGLMKVSEGYKMKVTTNTTLSITGKPVTLPYTISLNASWNIMGYPSMSSQSSLTAFEPLKTAGSLLKVQDENGNAIEKLPDPIGWIDNIHNLTPGHGFKVKTSINTSIAINSSAKGEYQNMGVSIPRPAHFKLAWKGNGLDQMNIYIKNPTVGGVGLKAGDEIGVFDGGRCVGAVVADDPNLEYLMVIASLDDPDTQEADGFIEGKSFDLRLWDNQAGSERKTKQVIIAKGYNNLFEKLGTSVLAVDFEKVSYTSLGDAYPNPSTDKTTFTFQLERESEVRLEIYNAEGDLIKVLVDQRMPGGMHQTEWDNRLTTGIRVSSGIYFYRLKLNNFLQTKKLVIQ